MPACGGSPGPGPPGRGTNGAKTVLICFFCAVVSTLSKLPSTVFWRAITSFFWSSVSFKRFCSGPSMTWPGCVEGSNPLPPVSRGHSRGLLFLICCEQLIQVGVDVFLDLVELLPLIGGNLQHFPRD